MEPFNAVLFVWSVLTICGTLLILQTEIVELFPFLWTFVHLFENFNQFLPISLQTHHVTNLTILFITFFEAIYAFGVVFISCEIGQNGTNTFEDCSEMVEQLNWYLFPAKIQRMMPIVIHYTQQSVMFKCFGSAASCRDTFKKVYIGCT